MGAAHGFIISYWLRPETELLVGKALRQVILLSGWVGANNSYRSGSTAITLNLYPFACPARHSLDLLILTGEEASRSCAAFIKS